MQSIPLATVWAQALRKSVFKLGIKTSDLKRQKCNHKDNKKLDNQTTAIPSQLNNELTYGTK